LEWVRNLSGEIICQDEITRGKEKAKKNHVEANDAGQSTGEGHVHIGSKRKAKSCHRIACDCFSSFGAVKRFLQTLWRIALPRRLLLQRYIFRRI
jgi:hypothetical protein